jgi:hypothetical protein
MSISLPGSLLLLNISNINCSLVIDDGLEISFLGVMLFVGLILMEIWFVAFLSV